MCGARIRYDVVVRVIALPMFNVTVRALLLIVSDSSLQLKRKVTNGWIVRNMPIPPSPGQIGMFLPEL